MSDKHSNPQIELADFIAQAQRDFTQASRVLRETRTLSATNTFQAITRVPGQNALVVQSASGPWDDDAAEPAVIRFDGTPLSGEGRQGAGGARYSAVFAQRPEIGTVIHVHTPYLGGWASAHRVLPIRYAPAQRVTLAREIPVYIDRRPSEASFILDRIAENPHTPAILEANGGATFWGTDILAVSKYILLLEEAAYFQGLAEQLGGGKEFGPGVLEQQWRMGGLYPATAG
ncbi:class II aldolase/adducin family protein [Jeongeupia naejangsanensis]|uniref:Class II aldolase/adducin family protein n=1 Tax=Jeongeupia naejangsanensis TaxID=613195 RepID=A0ABS2BG30_9NEIS|nr:class II aldolase/adducin family protein [Jeongeupia naejangsanensis]MBM3114577.1 class II aldolase/adducin family protein [Jeongeupia naejangsanensis]